ncbi:ABC transporter permease [Alterinioella nitratireducens]|uniref:ABC transporter permease n=1 Tax=Rhodobacterales TaxID=204455 RepID=UPI0040598526
MTQSPLPIFTPPRFQSLRTIFALMLREMSTTYGRSPGGYIWVILEPVGAVVLLSLAFSMVLRAPSLGTSFVLFYATGFLPFSAFMSLNGKLTSSLRFSRSLLAYPRVTWLDAVLARYILGLLTEITVFCVVITGILLLQETRAVITIGPILTGLSMAAVVGAGVGLMNCLLNGLFPVWGRIWTIISRPLFLASGIFFLYEDMPPIAQDILWWNPVLHATGEVRRGFYPVYEASYVSYTYTFGTGAVLVLLGLILIGRHHKRIIEN